MRGWLVGAMLTSACGEDGAAEDAENSTSTSAASTDTSTATTTMETGDVAMCEAVEDLCSRIPVDDVNAALGAMLTTATPQNMDAAIGPINTCNYGTDAGPVVALTRNCFAAGPTAAQEYYQTQKGGPATTEGEMVIDVAGLGTDAHLRIVPIGDNASLIVLDGPRVHLARRLGITGLTPDDLEAQLRPLADAMLALD